MSFGLIIVAATMLVALYFLVQGIRGHAFEYFGHEISRSKNRAYFWFAMLVALLVLINGIWMLPFWIEAI